MASSAFEEALSGLHRGVLGVLTAFLGMTAYGVAIRAFPSGDYLVGVAAALGAVLATVFVVFLFVEGLREG